MGVSPRAKKRHNAPAGRRHKTVYRVSLPSLPPACCIPLARNSDIALCLSRSGLLLAQRTYHGFALCTTLTGIVGKRGRNPSLDTTFLLSPRSIPPSLDLEFPSSCPPLGTSHQLHNHYLEPRCPFDPRFHLHRSQRSQHHH